MICKLIIFFESYNNGIFVQEAINPLYKIQGLIGEEYRNHAVFNKNRLWIKTHDNFQLKV